MQQIFRLAALGAAVSLSMAVGAQERARIALPDSIEWRPSGRADGLLDVDLLGDASQAGPVVYRVRFPAHYKVQAHVLADARTYTVISGVWYVGLGTQFDESKLTALPAGSFYARPAQVPHFTTTKDEGAVVQITATGPVTRPRFIDPAYR